MKRRAPFQLNRGLSERERMQTAARAKALARKVAQLRRRSNVLTRTMCKVRGHKPWPTGVLATAPDGTRYSIAVCERCGARLAVAGADVAGSPAVLGRDETLTRPGGTEVH